MSYTFSECTKCKSSKIIKAGIIKASNRQRYRCKDCNYFFTIPITVDPIKENQKLQALKMYLRKSSFRAIADVIGVSHVTVYKWIRSFAEKDQLHLEEGLKFEDVEIDEIYSYVKRKKRPKKQTNQKMDMDSYR